MAPPQTFKDYELIEAWKMALFETSNPDTGQPDAGVFRDAIMGMPVDCVLRLTTKDESAVRRTIDSLIGAGLPIGERDKNKDFFYEARKGDDGEYRLEIYRVSANTRVGNDIRDI